MLQPAMRVSIAMALYNGERFLLEQLDSINDQTQKPFEVVACDDGSIDCTEEIFRKYSAEHRLANYKYHRNEKNLGYTKNFIHAASLCSGDIIMFSDQDDIWDLKKIEKMVSVFINHPDAEAVVCAYEPFVSTGVTKKSMVEFLKKVGYKRKVHNVPFYVQVKMMLSGGLTLAVRKETLDRFTGYIEENDLTYDMPIGLLCAANNTLYRIPDVLVRHRIHGNNAGNPNLSVKSRLKDIERHVKGRKVELHHLKSVYEIVKDKLSETERVQIEKEIHCRAQSIEALESRNVSYLFFSIFRRNLYCNRIMEISNFLCCLMCVR